MQHLTISDSDVDWVIDCPESVPILEKYGIDYCCGGKLLTYACEQREPTTDLPTPAGPEISTIWFAARSLLADITTFPRSMRADAPIVSRMPFKIVRP
jgi:hypothetical protein